MTVVIGTAGHIDHGKTTLLRALTGIDADRLPEEQRRGMTIDVGYAWLELPDGSAIDFVDVPGHDALIGNMLVGAGEVDAALLVVAADDGIRAQTVEHLALLDAIGIRDGLAVVTKADAVDAGRAAEVVRTVASLLARTGLAGAPIVTASAASGAGIDELRAAVVALGDRVAARQAGRPPGPARLAIDRAFSVKGRGVVVTGTLRDGEVRVGDRLRLLPAGREARVRGLQVHHAPADLAGPGRVALNLAAVELGELARGGVLAAASDDVPTATFRLLVALSRPADLGVSAGRHDIAWPPPDGARLRLHLGTAAVEARLGNRGREAAELPDGRRTAILNLARAVATFPGDRAVLRRPSPGDLVAGVEILDATPAWGPARRRVTPERLATLAAAVRDGDGAARLDARLAIHGLLPTPAGPLVAADVAEGLDRAALEAVAEHHATEPASSGISAAGLRGTLRAALRRVVAVPRDAAAALDAAVDVRLHRLVERGRLARDGDRYRDPRRTAGPPPALADAMDRLEALLDVLAPPDLSVAARAAACPPEGIRDLERAGRIVRVEADLAWSAAAYKRLEATALDLARRGPLAPAALRDATGTSRRVVMPLLEDLNRRGLLVRTAAGHVPGPRAPRQPAVTSS